MIGLIFTVKYYERRRNEKTKLTKLLAGLLCLIMVGSVVPFAALASETDETLETEEIEITEDVSVPETIQGTNEEQTTQELETNEVTPVDPYEGEPEGDVLPEGGLLPEAGDNPTTNQLSLMKYNDVNNNSSIIGPQFFDVQNIIFWYD